MVYPVDYQSLLGNSLPMFPNVCSRNTSICKHGSYTMKAELN